MLATWARYVYYQQMYHLELFAEGGMSMDVDVQCAFSEAFTEAMSESCIA